MPPSVLLAGALALLLARNYLGNGLGAFFPVFEAFEYAARILWCAFQRIEYLVPHLHSCLEGGFLTAILAIREVFGKLVPLAADAESPALKGRGLVCVSGNVALGHIVVAGLSTGCAPILPHLDTGDNLICYLFVKICYLLKINNKLWASHC